MPTLQERTLQIALAEIGVQEDPPGSNRGPRVDDYLAAVGLNPAKGNYPWCAAFVCWCVEHAVLELGGPPLFRPSALVATLQTRNLGLALDAPEPGCVFVHLGPDGHGHTGFVESVAADGTLHTVEGNTDGTGSRTGGQVMRQRRAPAYVAGYIAVR